MTQDVVTAALDLMRSYQLLPEAYMQGVQGARTLAFEKPGAVVLLGHTYPEAPWFFFPLNMSMKYTLPAMALMALAVFGLGRVFKTQRRELLFPWLRPASIC